MKKYIVIIGAKGFSGIYNKQQNNWNYCTKYTAYKTEDNILIKEDGYINITSEKNLSLELKNKVHRDMAILVNAEKENNNIIFKSIEDILDVDVHSKDIEEFINKQMQPVYFDDSTFGTFTLDRTINTWITTINYNGGNIRIYLDSKEQIKICHDLFKNIDNVLEKAYEVIAKDLLEVANDWYEDTWEEEGNNPEDFVYLNKKSFSEKITLCEIAIEEGNSFSLWFDDGNIFLGHVIVAYFDKEKQAEYAEFMG